MLDQSHSQNASHIGQIPVILMKTDVWIGEKPEPEVYTISPLVYVILEAGLYCQDSVIVIAIVVVISNSGSSPLRYEQNCVYSKEH